MNHGEQNAFLTLMLPAHDVTDDKMKTYLRTTLESLRITHTLISLTQETPIQS